MKSILLIWNGMAVKQVSGGDIYTKKVIENSGIEFDSILSGGAKNILTGQNIRSLYVTDDKYSEGTFGQLWLYASRVIVALHYVRKLRKRGTMYSAILASSPFIYDLIPAIATKHTNKIVILFHLLPKRKGDNLSTRLRFRLANMEQKLSLMIINKYFNIIMAGNEEVKKELQQRFPNKKIVIAHAGIDTKKIDGIENQIKNPDMGIFVGRLTVQKGILDLVDVAKAIEKEQPGFKLIIVGDGPDKNLLQKKIDKEGVKSISFAGFVNEAAKYKLMKQAKFFIFPSREEGWGIALAEALYCGCLSFCYELPHYRSIFSDYPIYVRLNDSKELSKQLLVKYQAEPTLGQQKFISQYDDGLVVEDVLRQVNHS